MSLLFTIFASILAIFFVVLIHELGHLLVAKAVGVKVLRFSIGFGKVLFSIRGKETEYAISLLPLGGYVKMLGEEDESILDSERHRAFNRQPVFSRMLIVLAGPVTNFILAVVLFWIIFLPGVAFLKPIIGEVSPHSIAANAGLQSGDRILQVGETKTLSWQKVFMTLVLKLGDKTPLKVVVQGKNPPPRTHSLKLDQWQVDPNNPDFLGSLGIAPYSPKIPPILQGVEQGSAALLAGLKAGDRIVSLDGKAVDEWAKVAKAIQARPNQILLMIVNRDNKRVPIRVMVSARTKGVKTVGFIGAIVQTPPVPPELIEEIHYNVLSAWVPAFEQTYTLANFNARVLYKIVTADISPKTLGGPVTVFRMAGQASHGGWVVYLGFMAFVSVSLGFINLLPVPGLDGGHFLFLCIEAIIRRPLPEAVQVALIKLGMLLLVGLIAYATFNDLFRLFH
jgi:regulator of sigma E protease